nr:hypothetical protein Iba_chr03bCG0450 [Ipomoea batatas]
MEGNRGSSSSRCYNRTPSEGIQIQKHYSRSSTGKLSSAAAIHRYLLKQLHQYKPPNGEELQPCAVQMGYRDSRSS